VVLNGPTPPTGTTYTYQWYNGTTPVATTSSYTASTSGNYTVQVTNTATGCIATTVPATVVTVGAPPPSAITPSASAQLCAGSSLTLSTFNAPGVTYQWYNGATPMGTAATQVVTAAGNYTVTVSTGPGCSSTTTTPTAVTVNPLPTASATAAGPTTFCAGTGVTLNANTGTGISYQWNNNGTPISGATTASYNATASGTYTVTTTNTGTGCSNTSGSVAVTANALPNIAATPATTPTFCAGGNVVLNASPTTGLTYQWKLNGTNITGQTSGTYTATATGNYTVTATNSNGCVGTSQVVSVLVNPLPVVNTIPTGNAGVCQGNTTTLTVPTGAGLTYQWYLNGSPITGQTNNTYSTGTGGTYTVKVTNSVTGCNTTSAAINLSVSTPPPAIATAAAGTTICQGDSLRINANSVTGYTYQWRLNGTNIVGATGDNYYAKTPGSYTVVVANPIGCSTVSNSVALTVNPTPASYITYSTALQFCEGSAVVLNANAGAGLTYQWLKNGTPIGNTSITNIANQSGTYSVRVSNTFGCSMLSDTLNVQVYPKPHPVITSSGGVLSTTNSYVTYQWFFNNNPIGGATNPTYTFTQNGSYKVHVIDANGCDNTSEIFFVNNLGVAGTPGANSIKVYPNPTSGVVHITSAVRVKVNLRDVTGKTILEASDVKEINLADVANGTYLLYITNMEGQLLKVEKLTKSNN